MNLKHVIIPTLAALLFLSACESFFSSSSPPAGNENPRDLSGLENQLVASGNAFGIDLFKQIVQAGEDDNIFISPLSVAMALGMTLNGAAGQTYEDMKTTLGFGGMTEEQINQSFQDLISLLVSLDPDVAFDIANSIWIRDTFEVLQSFIDVNQTYFDVEVDRLDFSTQEAVDTINGWVEENTNGKIEEIVDDPIDWNTVMFLINAIYFKGSWTAEFDPTETVDGPFTKPDGSDITVQTMRQRNTFPYFENDDFQAVNLPYGNGKFGMMIVLPKPDKDVDDLIEGIDSDTWAQWIAALVEEEGILHMPKFKLVYEKKLNDILIPMGMGAAFDPSLADFSRINPNVDLYISNVKHKTFVEIDEEGTEAAAVTSVEIGFTSVPDLFTMRVNRPFVFVIWEDHSDTILFIGKIVEPMT